MLCIIKTSRTAPLVRVSCQFREKLFLKLNLMACSNLSYCLFCVIHDLCIHVYYPKSKNFVYCNISWDLVGFVWFVIAKDTVCDKKAVNLKNIAAVCRS